MIQIGRFREHYGHDYPSFAEMHTEGDIQGKAKVVAYMKKWPPCCASPGIPKDAFTGERIPGQDVAYTDGIFLWGIETIYYFEKYNLKLPDSFIARALQ